MRRLILSVTVVLPLVFCSGCALFWIGAGAGAGVVAWAHGELESTERASLADVQKATVAGLADLEYRVVDLKRTEVSADIKAIDRDDREARVRLKRLDARDTNVVIRFGKLGNEDYSRLLLEKIQRRIKK